MPNIKEIIARRSPPGILVFDLEDRLLYSNCEALEMVALLRGGEGEEFRVPEEVLELCRGVRAHRFAPGGGVGVIRHRASCASGGLEFSVRALPLGDHGRGWEHSHVMVLMERVVESHRIDLEEARRKYQLSKRETEVLRLVCRGLSNREIAVDLYVSEFTAKDHLKSIMRKMGAGSRNEIMAFLI